MADSYSSIERKIIALTHEWIEAVGRRDGVALDRILDDEFMIVGWRPEGYVADKRAYIEDCLIPVQIDQPSYNYDRWQFRVRDNAVVATCVFESRAIVGGSEWGGTFSITYIWTQKDGRWQALACHSSAALPAPAAQDTQ